MVRVTTDGMAPRKSLMQKGCLEKVGGVGEWLGWLDKVRWCDGLQKGEDGW